VSRFNVKNITVAFCVQYATGWCSPQNLYSSMSLNLFSIHFCWRFFAIHSKDCVTCQPRNFEYFNKTLWFAIGDYTYLLEIVLHRLRCDALRCVAFIKLYFCSHQRISDHDEIIEKGVGQQKNDLTWRTGWLKCNAFKSGRLNSKYIFSSNIPFTVKRLSRFT